MKREIEYYHSRISAGIAKLCIIGSIIIAIANQVFHNMMDVAFVSALIGAFLYWDAYNHQVRHTQFLVDKLEGRDISNYF